MRKQKKTILIVAIIAILIIIAAVTTIFIVSKIPLESMKKYLLSFLTGLISLIFPSISTLIGFSQISSYSSLVISFPFLSINTYSSSSL